MVRLGKILIGGACVVFFFYAFSVVFGADELIVEQTYQSDAEAFGRASTNTWCVKQSVQAPDDFTLGRIDIPVYKNNTASTSQEMAVRIKTGGGSGFDGTTILATSTTYLARNSIIEVGFGPPHTIYEFYFDDGPAFSAGEYFYIELFTTTRDSTNFISALKSVEAIDGDPLPLQHIETSTDCSTGYTNVAEASATGNQKNDLAFAIYSGETDFIDITSPVNNATTTDFGYWSIDYGFAGAPAPGGGEPETGTITINYGTSSSSPQFSDSQNVFAWNDSSALIPKSAILNAPGVYYAQANLFSSSSVQLATSTMISFTIEWEQGDFGLPTSTSTISDALITCDPNSGFFANSFCKVLVWAFIPTTSVLDNFSGLKDVLFEKPPFGYWSEIKEALENVDVATSSVQLANLTSLEDNFFSYTRTAIQLIMWVSFAFWIFHRFRNIQL